MDDITIKRIEKAHPKIRESLLVQYKEANNLLGKNVRLRFAYVHRTPAEQHALFLQSPKVTNADSWQSIHNYGLAFDIVLLIDKDNNGTFETASWDTLKDFDKDLQSDWMEVTNYFKGKGWKWGGNFKSIYDAPHFEMTFGHTPKTLKALIDANNVIIENGITYPNI
jgi:peptidoglycan L-alanyl-D-glutamate endopeptidase CwlK